MTEKELIDACIKGDRKAQQQLYDKYASWLMAVSMRYSKSLDRAEDILQETFIKVFKHLGTIREYSNIAGWMKRILINTAINQQRGKLYLFPMIDVDNLKKVYDESTALTDFHFGELLAMVRNLPAGCQMIFNLYAIEGYSHKEIAGKLKISEGTSKSQYARAKILLQNKLKDERKKSYEKLK